MSDVGIINWPELGDQIRKSVSASRSDLEFPPGHHSTASPSKIRMLNHTKGKMTMNQQETHQRRSSLDAVPKLVQAASLYLRCILAINQIVL
eukprot:m.289850 g.289850  ORF g.289850 m.289850 type:complete len:92 (-) comp16227_c3_seq20:776-1051(-)